MTATDFVVETLQHRNIDRINFKYGPILVYPDGYRRDIAKLVRDGHVQFTTASGGHYTIDRAPRERHEMGLPAQDFVAHPTRRDVLLVRGQPGPFVRGTIVHEATHALQDFQRRPSDPETAEGAAYLAGWITSLLWGAPELPAGAATPTGHAYARRLAARFIHREIGYEIPSAEVAALNRLVATVSPERYAFNGI